MHHLYPPAFLPPSLVIGSLPLVPPHLTPSLTHTAGSCKHSPHTISTASSVWDEHWSTSDMPAIYSVVHTPEG